MGEALTVIYHAFNEFFDLITGTNEDFKLKFYHGILKMIVNASIPERT